MTTGPLPPLSIDFQAQHFPAGAKVPASGQLRHTWSDLAHALFVTGRAPGDAAKYRRLSLFEWLHRVAVIPAYLDRSARHVARTSLADSLDRSEKVNLSYALGQAGASLFCQDLLGVARLMHVDRYTAAFGLTFGPSRRRPDLFGLGAPGWVVAEAKGRSNNPESVLPATLRSQKSAVSTIAGSPPGLAVGCITFFDTRTRLMNLTAIDPPPTEEGIDIPVEENRAAFAYYDAFVDAIGDGELLVVNEVEYITAPDLPQSMALGLRRDLYEGVISAREGTRQLSLEVPFSEERQLESGEHADGSFVHFEFDIGAGELGGRGNAGTIRE